MSNKPKSAGASLAGKQTAPSVIGAASLPESSKPGLEARLEALEIRIFGHSPYAENEATPAPAGQ